MKSLEKERLAQAIKAAVRSGKKRKRIYRPVHNHSYSAIPLIPIEEQPYAVTKEINTSFTVQVHEKKSTVITLLSAGPTPVAPVLLSQKNGSGHLGNSTHLLYW